MSVQPDTKSSSIAVQQPHSGRRASRQISLLKRLQQKKHRGMAMQYERLVQWAAEVWSQRWPEREYVAIWASAECSNMVAYHHVKPGRKLRGKARYEGRERIECPVIVPISDYGARGRSTVLMSTAGAHIFRFTTEDGDAFEVIYASSYFDDDVQDLTAIALLPADRLETWAAFEFACARAVRPRIRRRRDVYIIGGTDSFFDPNIDWDDVILPEDLKNDLLEDMEAFFAKGVHITGS
jgi:hypothetical protein